jgi:predicted transcriptional regulator
MEIHLTAEEETELAQVAMRKGRDAGQLAHEVLGYYLKHEARFIEAVKRGVATTERGEFVEHDEVLARIERLFQR